MRHVLLFTCAISLLWLGCRKEERGQVHEAGADATASIEISEPDLTPVLAELTQALRKYSVEKRAVPASIQELVSAGYIERVPVAPQGKAFAIDARNVQVVVK